MKYITIATLAGTAVLFAGAASAQQGIDFSKIEIKTTDLGNKTYMLEGQGGDITIAVGTDGIIMVDTQFAPLHDKIKDANRENLAVACQICDHHPLPWRSRRGERGLPQGRRDHCGAR